MVYIQVLLALYCIPYLELPKISVLVIGGKEILHHKKLLILLYHHYNFVGTSAITSLMIGQLMGKFVASAQYIAGEWSYADVAIMLGLFSGFIILFIGLFRLGALFHFISQPAISGFIAGSGLTIVINQFSKIFGISNVNTSEAPYLVFGHTLMNLNHSTIDAVFGISALVYVYTVKYTSQYLMRRYPQHNRWIFFFNTSRSIVVLVFGTLICFMINHFGHFEKSPISIIGDVPAGFNHMAVPTIKMDLLSFFISDLPGIVVLIVMEHGAISTSLGKASDYKGMYYFTIVYNKILIL